jgi:hypothetical protein
MLSALCRGNAELAIRWLIGKMKKDAMRISLLAIAWSLGAFPAVAAQSADRTVELVVPAGRPLRVALDGTLTVKRVGQQVTATLVEPVYAYDRIVLPAGTPVLGHVTKLENAPRWTRIRAKVGGDFSPQRSIVLQFDTIVKEGESIPIQTLVKGGVENVGRQAARGADTPDTEEKDGVVARAGEEVKQRAKDTVSAAKQQASDAISYIKGPDKMERLKQLVINRLPYHPQFLHKGTVYSAELLSPLMFGPATPTPFAPAGTRPAPSSILSARLVTSLDSAKTPRGTPLEAVVTEPVFSDDHLLILPVGTKLTGEVTFARHAERFHRNGQLRFLFERAQPPDEESTPLLASLHSVDISRDDHVVLDDEGGASVTNSGTRFVAPALSILALRGSVRGSRHGADGDGDANDLPGATPTVSGNLGAQGLGGFFGFGLLGVGLSQISQPVGVAFAVVGAARTVYTNILGRGQELKFPAHTPIQVRLAPGPAGDRSGPAADRSAGDK